MRTKARRAGRVIEREALLLSRGHVRSAKDDGFEPFGGDWLAGSEEGASESGVFLRLPGQWDDEVWAESSLGVGLYYNVRRWYGSEIGRYSRSDPLGLAGGLNLFSYVDSRPLLLIDPLGLCSCDDDCPSGKWTYFGASGGAAFMGGMSLGRGFYQCEVRRARRGYNRMWNRWLYPWGRR